jgi:hypothetical protein
MVHEKRVEKNVRRGMTRRAGKNCIMASSNSGVIKRIVELGWQHIAKKKNTHRIFAGISPLRSHSHRTNQPPNQHGLEK